MVEQKQKAHSIRETDVRAFILGGNAEFTVRDIQYDMTFKFVVQKARDSQLWFVKTVYGNKKEYAGCLIIDRYNCISFRRGKKGNMDKDDLPIQVLLYALNSKALSGVVEVYHVGKCSVCGRKLADIESIERGIGPVCYKRAITMCNYSDISK